MLKIIVLSPGLRNISSLTSQYQTLGPFLSDKHMQQLNLTDRIAPSDFELDSLWKSIHFPVDE